MSVDHDDNKGCLIVRLIIQASLSIVNSRHQLKITMFRPLFKLLIFERQQRFVAHS